MALAYALHLSEVCTQQDQDATCSFYQEICLLYQIIDHILDPLLALQSERLVPLYKGSLDKDGTAELFQLESLMYQLTALVIKSLNSSLRLTWSVSQALRPAMQRKLADMYVIQAHLRSPSICNRAEAATLALESYQCAIEDCKESLSPAHKDTTRIYRNYVLFLGNWLGRKEDAMEAACPAFDAAFSEMECYDPMSEVMESCGNLVDMKNLFITPFHGPYPDQPYVPTKRKLL